MITIAILALTIGFSAFAMNNDVVKYKYLFYPYLVKRNKEHYRFLSHAFLHADYLHLAFNMYALWLFGPVIENQVLPHLAGTETELNTKLGGLYYILLYTGGIYASSIPSYFKNKDDIHYTSLGASGAINSLIFCFILVAPSVELGFFFIPMPAWVFGLLYLGISFYLSNRNSKYESVNRIAHDAHFYGALFGIIFTGILDPSLFPKFIEAIIK